MPSLGIEPGTPVRKLGSRTNTPADLHEYLKENESFVPCSLVAPLSPLLPFYYCALHHVRVVSCP